ncbi:hypothetical protein NQ317_018270 [Molorchus minor]|uniref:Uncharacterized protein n=1 Tax=Molorchus minor TaxID=1323400 RepID=A0ABQ9K5B7_9CUCU|nr:hypothetical protein NQ317_018270 [Molorchus minor]
MAFNRLCKHLGVSHIVKMQPKVVKSNNCPEDTEQSGSLGRDREKKRKKKGKKQRTAQAQKGGKGVEAEESL